MRESLTVHGNTLSFQGREYRCAIGKGGLIAASDKREGDGCTPIGTWTLRECWYRPDRMRAPETQLPLRIIAPEDKWCDDPGHILYNKHFTVPSPFRGEGQGGGESPTLLAHARQLRKNMTEAEKTLWYHLRAHRFAGYGFRRQRPLGGKYIVDFLCPKHKLIIEVDGGQHAESKNDKIRDTFLHSEGYRVLRFWNNEVLTNLEGVLATILQALENTPSPTLPPKGGGSFSYESLWREDGAYDLIIPLGYNDDPVIPGKGSAIFLHCAKENYTPTEGCVALEKNDLLALLPTLSKSDTLTVLPS